MSKESIMELCERENEYRQAVSYRLPPTLLRLVEKWAEAHEVTNTEVVEKALYEYLGRRSSQTKKKR